MCVFCACHLTRSVEWFSRGMQINVTIINESRQWSIFRRGTYTWWSSRKSWLCTRSQVYCICYNSVSKKHSPTSYLAANHLKHSKLGDFRIWEKLVISYQTLAEEFKMCRNGNSTSFFLHAGHGKDFWTVVYPTLNRIAVTVRYVSSTLDTLHTCWAERSVATH